MELNLFSSPGEGDISYIVEACKPYFAGKSNPTIAYLPTANLQNNWLDYTIKAFAGLATVKYIDVEALNYQEIEQILATASVLYISGGNTFYLADKLHHYDLMSLIKDKVQSGLPLVGFSAGMILAGQNILTANDLNVCATTKFGGLALVSYNFVPHFPSDEAGRTDWDARLAEYHIFYPNPVYALKDGGYLKVVDDAIGLVHGKGWLYEWGKERQELKTQPKSARESVFGITSPTPATKPPSAAAAIPGLGGIMGQRDDNVTPSSSMAANLVGMAGQTTPPPPPPSNPAPDKPGVGGSSWGGSNEGGQAAGSKRSSEDFSSEVQGITEQLYEDEALRRNLSDDEAQALLDWGANWLTTNMPERYKTAKDDQQLDQTLEEGRQFVRDKIQTVAAELQKNPSDDPLGRIKQLLAN